MPPQKTTFTSLFKGPAGAGRAIKFLVAASTVVLAGCATSPATQQADASDSDLDAYLSATRSDPMGAYLRSYERQNYPAYPTSRRMGAVGLASTALDFLGTKYSYGGDAPSTGFDCSGLVIYAAEKSLGLKLPRRSAEIAREGISVKKNELRKGDLVFFNTLGHRYSHVGIYLGNQKFVHAPRTGSAVRIEDMDIAYWKKRYNGARRLIASSGRASR
jgi:cell wall-associated NlpC family hydrolase